jgi:aspartyl-tRNA(Asn)/glutamyl-tRNA(Gln) amidotransferase subunit A
MPGAFDVVLCASTMDPRSRIENAEGDRTDLPATGSYRANITGHPALAKMRGLVERRPVTLVQFVGLIPPKPCSFQLPRAWERAGGYRRDVPP